MESSTFNKPSGGGGMSASTLLFLSATTSLMSEPTNGHARDVGTGVTRPIHKLERFGVNTGT